MKLPIFFGLFRDRVLECSLGLKSKSDNISQMMRPWLSCFLKNLMFVYVGLALVPWVIWKVLLCYFIITH